MDNIRGTVYSWGHPNKKICIMISDRAVLNVGEIFTFKARYCLKRANFLIYDYFLCKNELSVENFPSSRGFLVNILNILNIYII